MTTDRASAAPASALRLTALHVRRMPGIPDGFELPSPSEGVTVVVGPNASGKSSTARAIEAALWPAQAPRRGLGVVAEYRVGDSLFRVELDAGHVTVQRDGAEAPAPELPAPELRHRYRLSLHELLRSEDQDFARVIATQSAGGYDIAAAASALGFREQPSAARNESAAVGHATEELKTAQRAQREIEGRASRLNELRRRRDEARLARERRSLLSLAAKHCAAAAEAERARQIVGDFPSALAKMAGTEHANLCALREKIRGCNGEIATAGATVDANVAAAAALLSDGAPAHSTLASMRAGLESLRECQRKEAECQRNVEAVLARQTEARRSLAGSGTVTDEQLAKIDAGSFGELADFAREAEQLRASVDAAEATLRGLADVVVPADLDSMRMGIKLLTSWLAADHGQARGGSSGAAALWGAASLAALAWGIHAVRWHWAFAMLAVLAILLAVLGTRKSAGEDQGAGLQREYERLSLQRPSAWDVEEVRKLLDLLQVRLAEGRLAEQRSVLRERAVRERAALEERLRSVGARGAELASRLGVAPDTDQRQLSWLADRLGHWHVAALDAAGARAALAAATVHYASQLSSIAQRLGAFGYDRLETPANVAGAIEELERRVREHHQATERADEARRRIAEQLRARDAYERECQEILERVGVQDDAAVERLCSRFEEYGAACDALRLAIHSCEALRSELRAMPGFEPELEEQALATLELERDQAAAAAGELDELTDAVARLEQEVHTAKHASDVESAIASVAGARAVLQDARDRDFRSMIGSVVTRHVQQLTRDRHRPGVFHRARELFATITRGQQRLDFDDGDAASFRAFDVNVRAGRALEELSSATRMQLLLAVRVAFVETQERGIKLPLLLDETLGTSDDERARAMIDAVIALAGEGRQIFYFTAQHDEAGKWLAALAASGTPHSMIDLAAVRGQRSIPITAPLPITSVPALEVLEPDGCTHADYGALLRVPAFRPGFDSPESAPLWYVVDDPDELCRLMRSGIRTWGELHNLVESGGERVVEGSPTLWGRARGYARALEALCREAAIGLGRPVDRAVLLDSGAVSDRQMERVWALCESCAGDARALVEGLEGGGAPGFLKKKIAELREYLEREGYLDERPRRTEEQIRGAMLGALGPAVAEGELQPADVDVLVRRLEQRRKPIVSTPLLATDGQPASRASRISAG